MILEILEPHGFCAGVTHALACAQNLAMREKDAKIYCYHELVHNELVVRDLVRRGFIFVDSLDTIPDGAHVLFSAHGVSPKIREKAREKNLAITDATCPFVTRVHREIANFAQREFCVVIIGHAHHAEVVGLLGEAPHATVIENFRDAENFAKIHAREKIGVVSQTTMNSDDVAEILAILKSACHVETTAEVCHATKERQDAVKKFTGDALLVLGSANSSNTRRLCEIATCETFRVATLEDVRELDFSRFSKFAKIGLTSGASTPESFFRDVVQFLREKFAL